MKIITYEDGGKSVSLTPKEYRAFEIIQFGRDLGLPPQQTFKELKENNLRGAEIRAGQRAYQLAKKGAQVTHGGSDEPVGNKALFEPSRPEDFFR